MWTRILINQLDSVLHRKMHPGEVICMEQPVTYHIVTYTTLLSLLLCVASPYLLSIPAKNWLNKTNFLLQSYSADTVKPHTRFMLTILQLLRIYVTIWMVKTFSKVFHLNSYILCRTIALKTAIIKINFPLSSFIINSSILNSHSN